MFKKNKPRRGIVNPPPGLIFFLAAIYNGKRRKKEGDVLGAYIRNRFLQLIPILFGVTFLTFGMMQFAAGDAVDMFYDQSGSVAEEVKAERRAQLGLDQPFLVQYGSWLKGMAVGDLGRSYISGKLVWESFMEKLPATILLMLVSLGLTLLVALPLGILAAVYRGSPLDMAIRALSFVGNSLPNFFVALLLLYFFALKLHWLPVMSKSGDSLAVFLPAGTLAIAMGAKYLRQIRAVILEELGKPYVSGLRSRGIGTCQILWRSVLKTALPMLVTLLALSIGSLLGGTVIVETVFLWDGVGKLAVDAVLMRDYPLIQAYVAWMSILYVSINLLADLAVQALDPRIRAGKEQL